ncbi:MAG: hypothetical protein ACK56F_27835 [bacterium]
MWQYIHMTKRINLIDCPGVVYAVDGRDEVGIVLRGVVRAEKLEDPEYYIPAILEQAKLLDLQKIYGVKDWQDCDDFLKMVATKKGKLMKVNREFIGREANRIPKMWLRIFSWIGREARFRL